MYFLPMSASFLSLYTMSKHKKYFRGQIQFHRYQRFIIEAQSFRENQKGLICWDVERLRKQNHSFLDHGLNELLWLRKPLLCPKKISQVEMTDDLLYVLSWHFHQSFIKLGHGGLTFQKKSLWENRRKWTLFIMTVLRLYFRRISLLGGREMSSKQDLVRHRIIFLNITAFLSLLYCN